ncbi:MAG: fimbrillin family protein [Bacteroidales bacterium]|nr:fimbrillin family protein [Bacteroidales bacterium]
MKKDYRILILTGAAILMAACSSMETDNPKNIIRFQTANYMQAPSATTKSPENYADSYLGVPFGVYAWYKAEDPADNTVFMDNQKVSYNSEDNLWTPTGTTYYWPKSGSLDFICYSPWSDVPPVISENSISYSGWDVTANQTIDLLYADKSTGLSKNAQNYYYNGVPVLFHHALARTTFNIKLAYSEITPETGDKTKWEVTVDDFRLKNIRTTGNLTLTLDSGEWKRPESNVWTSNDSVVDIPIDCSSLPVLADTATKKICDPFFVLPQTLDQGQKLALKLTIKTWRDSGSGYPVEPFITETDVLVDASLGSFYLTKWGINQSIKYNLVLIPSRAGSIDTPAEITFDPAVSDWESIDTDADISL